MISVKESRPTVVAQRSAISAMAWWFQNQRPGPGVSRSSARTASRNSGQVLVAAFWTDSCHIAGMLRARSRAVSTTWRSVSGNERRIWRIFTTLRGPRNSIEITASPSQALTSPAIWCQGPSGAIGSWRGPPRSIRS